MAALVLVAALCWTLLQDQDKSVAPKHDPVGGTGESRSSGDAVIQDLPASLLGATDRQGVAEERSTGVVSGESPADCLERYILAGLLDSDGVAALKAECSLESVGAQQIAKWACTTAGDFRSVSAVFGERLAAEPWDHVVAFVVEFQEACGRFQETGLTVGALTMGRQRSQSWYLGVLSTLDERSLLPPSGSEAAIQLAESFVSAQHGLGDPQLQRLLEEIGRGQHAGSDRQAHRAALITLVSDRDPYRRLAYIGSLIASPAAQGSHLAQLMGEFLGRGQCLLNGDARPSLELLLVVLRDDRFAKACAAQLRQYVGEPPPQGDDGLWRKVVAEVELLVAEDP